MRRDIRMGGKDRDFRTHCTNTDLFWSALLTAAFLSLILAIALGGCARKEEQQKIQSTPQIQPKTSQTKSVELTESAAMGRGDQRSLAVIDFENQTGDRALDWLSKGIAEMLITDLSQSPDLQVLSGQRLFNILGEMNRESLDPKDLATATEVARRAESEAMVLGSFTKIGKAVRIDLQLLDVATSNLMRTERVEGNDLESIFNMVDQLSKAIKNGLNISQAEDDMDQEIVNLTTSSVEAYKAFTMGLENFYRFKLSEAVVLMERAVQIDPNFALAYAVVASYLNSIGDVRRTTAATNKAMALRDRLPQSQRLMVMAIDAQIRGDYDEGDRLYQKLLGSASEEEKPIVHMGLGQLYFAKGQLEGSKRIYKKILQLDPDQAAGHFMLGLIQFQKGIKDSAESELREAVRLSPDIAAAHLLLAQICFVHGQKDEVESHMQSAIDADPENPSIRNFVGYYYLNQGKRDQALAEFKQHVALAPDDPNSHDSLAEAYFRQGNLKGAEKEYLQAIRLDPNFANPRYMLALIYEQKDQPQKAIQQLEEFIRLNPEDIRIKDAQNRIKVLQQK
jgi:tetratricopeptide (TPR) repeat protein